MARNSETLSKTDAEFKEDSSSRAKKLLRKGIVGGVGLAVAAGAVAGCGPNDEVSASPSPTETSQPYETPSPTESTPDTTETEAPEYTMSATVNYELFEGWDALELDEKRERCNTLFADNGLELLQEGQASAMAANPQQILDHWQARYDIAWDINLDLHDERNQEVGNNILECITSPRGGSSDAFHTLSQRMSGAGDYFEDGVDISPNPRGYDLGPVSRYSGGVWTDSQGQDLFVVEQYVSDKFGDAYMQRVFEEPKTADDWYLAEVHIGDGGDIKWGVTQPPVVIDENRADAPYDLGR